MKVSARGIYSTGFLSLLRDLGYELTNLSEEQSKRFNLYSNDKEDISVLDLKDKSGVVIIGKDVDNLINKLRDILWDSLYYKKPLDRYSGKYIEIKREGGIEFKTSEEKKKEILEKLGNKILGLNITFKETCNNASIEEIEKEIKDLQNISKYYVNLGYNSKIILDEYRKRILPTIKNHHVYRRDLSNILDFSEILLKYAKEEDIIKSIKEFIVKKLKQRGYIKRYHRKTLTGLLIEYIEVIKDIKLIEDKIYLETIRLVKSDGYYDGMNIKKEQGDYVISKYLEGEWYFVMEYYNKNNELKGRYININTPLEITTKVNYNDIAIDVVEVNGEMRPVDMEELEALYRQGVISEKLYRKALELVENILKNGTF
ncbi:DUF402 domain-containing protein [Nanoarchaeota archaeon NZ13-N]|nr:MAG: DUF402 domain-containing protein [Nanoarchaeota archaeon NZ13-N]